MLLAAATVASCAANSGGQSSARPADVYAIIPTQADVRTFMGDSTWWGGPPSFEVPPLNWLRTPESEKFAVIQEFLHLGTDERMVARYLVFNKASSATTEMSNLLSIYSGRPTTPKIGDQTLYVVQAGLGGAPYEFFTFVRVGQIFLTVIVTRKDANTTVTALSRIAKKFADPLRNLGKAHATLTPVDSNLLPPPGFDVTMLGSANLPLESFVVMQGTALPDTVFALLKQAGVTTFAYGDYALNADPTMEVQTGIIRFPSASAATDWADTFSPSPPDASGIGSGYIKGGSTPGAGVYHYVFASGSYGALIVCKAATTGTAATRECEDPSARTAIAWKAGLEGLR
jgi:hypothetical protein